MLLDFYPTFTYRGTWDSSTSYAVNDLVKVSGTHRSGSRFYKAATANINENPTTNRVAWDITDYMLRGTWVLEPNTPYRKNDVVVGSNRFLFFLPIMPWSGSTNYDPTTAPSDPGTSYPWQRFDKDSLLDDIRSLVWISLTANDLPDSIIIKPAFLRAAELELIERLGFANNRTGYDQKIARDPDFKERLIVAVQNKTAANIIPALPQIIEREILEVQIRYAQVDWQQKIAQLDDEVDTILKPDLPTGASVTGSVFMVARRFVGY